MFNIHYDAKSFALKTINLAPRKEQKPKKEEEQKGKTNENDSICIGIDMQFVVASATLHANAKFLFINKTTTNNFCIINFRFCFSNGNSIYSVDSSFLLCEHTQCVLHSHMHTLMDNDRIRIVFVIENSSW